MAGPIELDFRARLVVPLAEQLPDGAVRLSLSTRGPEQVALYLSYPSLEALWFELTSALAEIRAVLTRSGETVLNGHGALNGWGRILGVIGIPGAIAFYLVWWITQALGARLDRVIQLLEQIARALKVPA